MNFGHIQLFDVTQIRIGPIRHFDTFAVREIWIVGRDGHELEITMFNYDAANLAVTEQDPRK